MELIYFAIIGIIAGWLAGQIMKGRGFGLIGGGWVFGALGLSAFGTLGAIIMAVVGACILLFIVGALKKA
jgi:uncharacterized membrane protein YeaQ/YmgE (transglycosylase-associated protein family)